MSQNKAFSTPFILAVLCIYFSYFLHGISVITLAQNMSSLAEKFSTDNAGIAYLISGIGLGRLISILFFGVISDKFGRRAVILMAVIMYLLFFFGIPALPNLTLAYGLAVCAVVSLTQRWIRWLPRAHGMLSESLCFGILVKGDGVIWTNVLLPMW